MKLGISTATFFTRVYTEEAFDIIRGLGLDNVEVFLATFSEYTADFAKTLKANIGGLNIVSVHTLNQQFEPELFNPSPRTRKDCEHFLLEATEVAKAIGAKYYIFHGPARLKKTPYNIDYVAMGKRADEISELIAGVYPGFSYLYENVHWTYFSEPEFFANLKKHCKVNACLDIKQAMQSKRTVDEYLDVMGDRLRHVHLCDYLDNGKLVAPGKGVFDFERLLRRLKDEGFNGTLVLELYARDYGDVREVKASSDYLQEILYKIGS